MACPRVPGADRGGGRLRLPEPKGIRAWGLLLQSYSFLRGFNTIFWRLRCWTKRDEFSRNILSDICRFLNENRQLCRSDLVEFGTHIHFIVALDFFFYFSHSYRKDIRDLTTSELWKRKVPEFLRKDHWYYSQKLPISAITHVAGISNIRAIIISKKYQKWAYILVIFGKNH